MKTYLFILFLLTVILPSHTNFAQNNRGVANLTGERKIALIIGNTNYDSIIGRLKNPVNDAKDMAKVLKRLGFTLIGGKEQLDVNKRQMLELIREFGKQIKGGGVGFFYFSGHGVQVNKENYLIPLTDSLVYENDAETEAVNVDTVANEMENAENRLNILVLDACRNNSLLKRSKGSGKGLTEPSVKPEGTFIAFAARDGQTASDGAERNGLFTQELLKNLETPNARLDDIFTTTRNNVKKLSNGSQIPVNYNSTSAPIILNADENPVVQTSTPVETPASSNSQSMTSDSSLNETIVDYSNAMKIGSGSREFILKWSDCGNNCAYAYSNKLDGIANSKVNDFDKIGDFTAYDRSSRVREIRQNQIVVLRNLAGYYALVQIVRISQSSLQLTVRYKIIPEKRESGWKPNPAKYISGSSTGRVKFTYEDNNGAFKIGEGKARLNLRFGGGGRGKARLYNDDGISLISATGSGTIDGEGRTIDLKPGDTVTIANKNGVRAVIKIIDAETLGYSSETDKVEFDYQILERINMQ